MFERPAFLALVFSLFANGASPADVLHVPNDYPSIQAALDASVEGDQVLVAPGTYPENLLFPPRAVHLVSEAGPGVTVIDGELQGSVVQFLPGCPEGAVLEGFTLTNGLGAYGGGIYCAPTAWPTIRGNHIIQNQATYDGGGIFPRPENRVTIEDNLIGWNSAVGTAGGLQAPASDSTVRNNVLVGNVANYGGAYFARVESSVTLVNCTFFANEAPNGSVASGDGGLQLLNCVLDDHAGTPFAMYGGGWVSAAFSTIPGGAGQPWFGEGCVDADPRLAEPGAGDFRLRPTSPGLDAGHPDPAYQDLDSTRNDQGHDGGPAGTLRGPAWYPIPPLPEPRISMAVAVSGGRLYSIAGETAAGRTRTVLAYDAESDAWDQFEDYPGPEIRSASAVVLDGFVYLLGGYLYDYAASDLVWRFDPRQESWEERTSLPQPRLHPSVHEVSGRIYVLGGRSQPAWQYHNTTFVYDPSLEGQGGAPPWEELCPATTSTPLGDNSGVSVDGELFTFGSYEPAVRERVLHYSPGTGRWRELPASPLSGAAAAVRLGNKVFVLEGGSGSFWSWDPAKVLLNDDCSSGGEISLAAASSQAWGLDFRAEPQLPGPGGGAGVAVMDGLVYAVGGTWPMTERCWVFDRGAEAP